MRALFGGLMVLAACGGASSAPVAKAAPVKVEAAAPSAGVAVELEAGGVRVRYRALTPERDFRFDADGAEIRKDTWVVHGEGVALTPGGVTATSAVSGFDVAIAPDTKERDRVYPALRRVGEGWLLYAPHLRVAGASVPFRLSIAAPPGWSVVGHRDAAGALVGDGYVFVGPASYVHAGAADIISAPATPGWLVRMIDETANGAVSFYERRLDAKLGAHPTIVIEHEPQQSGSYHGDTTPGAVVSLRFFGSGWGERTPAAADVLTDFLDHEILHFWNAEVARANDGSVRPWFHEGWANYAALLLGHERGTVSDEALVANLDRHLERCQVASPKLDLREHGPTRGGAVYACGTVLEWAIDVGLRSSSHGRLDAFTWWKDVLAKARADGGAYSFDGAYALVAPDAKKAADALLAPGGASGWGGFVDAMRGYGVELVSSRQPGADLTDAVDHLLELECGRERGFRAFTDHLQLDGGMRCGALAGADVDAVAGVSVTEPSAMRDKVGELCKAGKAVDFGWKGKTVGRAACSTPLPPPRMGWQIKGGSRR